MSHHSLVTPIDWKLIHGLTDVSTTGEDATRW